MAKKQKKFDAQEYDLINLQRIEEYVAAINVITNGAIEDFAKLAASIPNIDTTKVFTFADYPGFKDRFERIVNQTTVKVTTSINRGIADAWNRSNAKNDALVQQVMQNSKLSERQLSRYYQRNLEALTQTRTPAAELSKRVFNINKQFVRIVEAGLDRGVGQGLGARQLARDLYGSIRKLDTDPEFLFRRVRNDKGELKWSRAAQKFAKENPEASGPGKYINPKRNFERVTRTEINRSYRKADQVRYDQLDFVVGIKINLSNNPNHCPMCIALAGIYPKGFVWAGWHPQCRCYKTTILKTDAEIERDNVRILEGKEPLKSSVNLVKKMPDNFNRWTEENSERLRAAIKRDKKPFWIRDSYKEGNFDQGVDLKKKL